MIAICAYGQEYQLQVQSITMQDGLPNRAVNEIMQEREGFLWMSTLYGLCRFDGRDFNIFKKSFTRLRDNNIKTTYQDDAGMIWIWYTTLISKIGENVRLIQDIDVLNPQTFEIKPFKEYFKSEKTVLEVGIISIHADESNQLWILTEDGSLYKYTSREGFVKNILLSKALEPLKKEVESWGKPVNLVALPHKENLRVKFNYDTTSILLIRPNKEILKLGSPKVHNWIDYQGQIWLQDTTRLNEFHVSADGILFKTIVYPFDPQLFRGAIADRNGNLWVSLKNEIRVYNKQQKLIGQLNKKSVPELANLTKFGSTFFDRQNNAWIPSSSGLCKVSFFKNAFTNYLRNGDTRAILVEEDGTIYANQWYVYRIGANQKILNDGQFVGLFKDGDFLYAGGYGPILLECNIITGTQQRIQAVSRQSRLYSIVPFKSKKTGKMWLGGNTGLASVDFKKGYYLSFKLFNGFEEISKSIVYFFYENKEGLWLATSNGIYLLDEAKGIIAHYKSIFPHVDICHIHEDKTGIFWLATKGGGLLRWDRTNNKVQQFTIKDGLSHEVIYAVYEDDFGYLWMPSNYGLIRFHKASFQVVNTFLPEDGIPHEEFDTYSHCKAPDGRLFFGGLGGITSFHPKDFLEDTLFFKAPLRITSFEKLNIVTGVFQNYLSEVLVNHKIVIRPNEKSFLLRVILLDYKNPKENQYAYKIDGLDKNWTYLESNVIQLGRLPYGTYTLHIKGRRADSLESEQEMCIPLWVIRPFYLQWWFIGLGLLSITGLIIAVTRWRIMQLKKNQQLLQAEVALQTARLRALDEQKSRFFLNVAHELRTPLTLINSPIELFLQKESSLSQTGSFLQSIQKNTAHLIRLVESILDVARLDAKQLELEEQSVHLQSLVRQAFGMYESYAAMQDIDYQLHYWADEKLALSLDVSKFEKILHNLLSNAIKFTPGGGRVRMIVQAAETAIIIQVADTGIGVPAADLPYIFERYFQSNRNDAAKGGIGIGLHIALEYARLMQGNLSVESAPGKGSTFSFVFPRNEVILDPPITPVNGFSEQGAVYSITEKVENKNHTLLIVEDHVEMQKLLLQLLAPFYHVLQAANGKKALEILAKQTVHGIITDIMMPEMDGFELVEHLKANGRWQNIPIIVLSARADEVDKLQALRIGVDDYLYKPFSPRELQVRIANLIVNYKKRLVFQQVAVAEEAENMLNVDQQWLTDLELATLELLKQNPGFKSSDVAHKMNLSEGHLRRKVRAITGLSANEYINEIRLQKAKRLLENKATTSVSQLAYTMGFSTPRYFTKLFVERFGKRPSAYLRNE